VLKTQRDSNSDERKPKFQSVLKSLLPVRPVGPIPEEVQSTRLVRSLIRALERFPEYVHPPARTCPSIDVATLLRRVALPSHGVNMNLPPPLHLLVTLHPVVSPLEPKLKH
jgi:hypothetical protein